MVAAIALAAIAGSFLTAVLFLIFRSGGSSSKKSASPPASGPSTTKAPTVAGAELAKLIDAGRNQTFHARYQATSSAANAGPPIILDLWRQPPMEREDLVLSSGGQVIRSAGFLLPPKSVLCRQTDGVTWTCANTPQSQADDLLKGVTGEVASQAAGVRDDVVGSKPVRCFTIPGQGAELSELCLTPEGITARLTTGTSKIELVDLSSDVPGTVFVPPATPTG